MSKPNLQPNEYRKIISFSADSDVLEKLDRVCEKYRIKRSVFIRAALRFLLAEVDNNGEK